MTATLVLETDGALATLRLARAHGNAINPALVADLARTTRQLAADPRVRGVLLASRGKLFCPGLDLQELVELDRLAMERFLHDFNASILGLWTFPKPLVAALSGHAVAGGAVLGLTADWRVLARGASVGLAELRVGVPFPRGVAEILRESIPQQRLAEVALWGRNFAGEEAVAVGLAHEVHDEDGFEAHCRSRLAELVERDAQAFELTKRYLREATAACMREQDPRLAHEFLDRWFSPPTRERIERVVHELRERSSG
jgi:enoyl-CoA hydratase